MFGFSGLGGSMGFADLVTGLLRLRDEPPQRRLYPRPRIARLVTATVDSIKEQ
jgi:hypothetical protein